MSAVVATITLNVGMSMAPRQVPPSAWIGHLPFAFWAVEEARPRILVELGSHNGTSYLGFCQAVARCGLDTKCFAVDTWQGDEHSGFYGDEVFEALNGHNAPYSGFSQLLRMTFDEALTYFADGSVDLLHIDGLHTYDAVKHDFESWLPKLSGRAVVLFHDTMVRERNFGVWKLWDELRAQYPGFEFQHTHGLGVLLVGAQAPKRFRDLAGLSGTDAQVPVLRLFDALGARIYAAERADAAEAGLAQALRNERQSMAAAQSAHEYLAGRVAELETDLRARDAALHAEAANAAVASEALRRLETDHAALVAHSGALEQERAALTARTNALEAEHAASIERGNALEAEYAVSIERGNALEAEYAASIERANALEAEYAASVERGNALEVEHAASIERGNALEVEHAVLVERANALEAEYAASVERGNALEAEHAVLVERASALEAEHAASLERVSGLEAEVARSRDALAAAHAQHAEEAGRAAELYAAITGRADALARVQVDLHAQLAARDAELAARHAQLDELLRSTSWKVTRPARWLSSLLRWKTGMNPIRATAGRALRGAYLRMPVSWKMRLRVKSVVFGAFAPVLKHTNAYRRWHTFGAQHGYVAVPPAPLPRLPDPEVSADGEPNAAARWMHDVLDRARAPRSAHYVARPADAPPAAVRAKAIAFYLPQFHPIAENDAWWGRGFTEWTNVSKAVPQFVGHEQPKMPGELGFYDLRLVDVMRRQAELARLHGVHGFCFHHYWFSGRRLLERPVDQFIANPDIDLPFCLCWANENWTRRWDGHDSDVLLGQNYNDDNDLSFIRDLQPYLRDPRYIRIDGRPLVIMYRPSLLPDCRHTLDLWREDCRAQGLGEIFLAMVQFDVDDPGTYGFDAALEFPPHKVARGLQPINAQLDIVNPDYCGNVVDYREMVDSALQWPRPDYPLFRGVSPNWDNEARKPGKGYTFAHANPAEYARWLEGAVDYAERHPVAGERVVFVNAWNEWAEGAMLEPDTRHGYANLDATRRVLETRPQGSGLGRGRIALISHDAHPHGAQYLALNLLRELKKIGLDVIVLLQGDGRLEPDFEALATVHRLYAMAPEAIPALARSLRADGCTAVIANTAVSGRVTPAFAAAGMRIVALVHELPGVIAEYGLASAVEALARDSAAVVVAAEDVRDGLLGHWPADASRDKLMVRPQGLFTRSRYRGLTDMAEARRRLREKLGVPMQARIVLAVGYADRRKGVDLLVDAATRCCARSADTHFVWVGHREVGLQSDIDAALAKAGLQDRFHFVGMDFDTDDYYAGADVYALSSREDPFPSVVLESLAVGTPVVAFAGTGGGARLVETHGAGLVVPALNAAAYADAIDALLDGEALRTRCGDAGRALIDREFSFRGYALTLANLAGLDMPRVSVVVPNYNYARYLESRLASIAGQSWPVAEIIVLDDASTDDSLAVLQSLRARLDPEPRIVVNADNSGSVFRQWRKGVELATGEYVWIAEADDLAQPAFLETLLAAIHGRPDVVMAYSESEAIDLDGATAMPDYRSYTGELSAEKWNAAYTATGNEEVAQALAVKNTIPNVSAVLFRREPLLEVLREHEDEICAYRIAGDWVAYLHLLARGGIHYHPASLNRHRRHQNSVTSASDLQRHYDEVVRAQGVAAQTFALDPRARAAAAAYAGTLRRQFGLPEPQTEPG